ncbi:MAG TPA: hypothetical protein VHH88_09730, partial [Verrucomicrobiae bacterium]|nr:hypothetical protein [Verrucomicrobiae bacterium]
VSGTVVASSSLAGAVTNSFTVNSDETDLDPASNTAQAAATVLVAITPRLSIAPKAAGQFELTIAAQAGLNYAIQQSADLTNWSTVSSGTANGSGILKYVTTNGPSFNRLFFRAVRVP